jgi:protein CpxP
MQIQKLYSTIKPYAVISLLVLGGISSLNVNAMGHKSEAHHIEKGQVEGKSSNKHHGNMKDSLRRLAKKLDLTPEQRIEIKAIYTAMKEDRETHKKSLSSFKEQMNSLFKAGKFDETKFSVIYDKYQKNFKLMAMEKAKRRHAIFQVLTPEQQSKFLTMRKHR